MLDKECRDCGQVKPVREFYKRKASLDGLSLYCKECFGLRNAETRRKRLERDGKAPRRPYRRRRVLPEGMKHCPRCDTDKPVGEFGRNRAEKSGLATYCKPCHNEAMAEIARRNYGSRRNYLLKLRYRLTAEQVENRLQAQGGVCVLCLRRAASHVDHDHMTGLLRALLCFPCNGALGQYDDDLRALREAAKYLEGTGSHSQSMLLEFGALTIGGAGGRVIGGRARGFLLDADGRRVARLGTARDDHLRRRYGVGHQQIQELLEIQQGWCPICAERRAEHVDHDHETGVVRGVLCGPCNTGMGQLGDDPVALRRAADYVIGELVREVPADDGGTRLSFTLPDVDPRTVPLGGWEEYRAKDGEHRLLFLQVEDRMHVQTRLRMVPDAPGFCRRHSYTGPRPSFAERYGHLVKFPPELFEKAT